MRHQPWFIHPALIGAAEHGVRTRLGMAPNHESFRAGVLRTHLLTALLAHSAARHLGVEASVFPRWDDTNQSRTGTVAVTGLASEITEIGQIPLAQPPASVSGVEKQILRQTLRVARYQQAIDLLRDQGFAEQRGGVWWLSLDEVDRQLTDAGLAARELVHGSLVNVHAVSSAHSTAEVPLTRADGSPLWHLATVVDDLDLSVNLVVRGTDKTNSVAVQERLRWALSGGGARVAYVFLPRLIETDRARSRVRVLLDDGIRPSALRWFLAEPYLEPGSRQPETFDRLVGQLRTTLPKPVDSALDERRLWALDRKITGTLSLDTAQAELTGILRDSAVPEVVRFVVAHWPRPLNEQLRLHHALTTANPPFDPPPPDAGTAIEWTRRWGRGEHTGSPPHAVRWVLTGCLHGPPAAALLPLFDLDLITSRLRQACAEVRS